MTRLTSIVIGALATTLAVGGPPFTVCRSTDPATVATTVLTSTGTSPFDDAASLLDDGQSYYYLVLDGGAPLAISVHRNEALNTVRVAFDDGQSSTAPVDGLESTVSVAPDTIPADGVTAALVTVVPRGANGTLLGAGLSVSLDENALWPGELDGAIVDRGDGSYEARVVSFLDGAGEAWVTVEAVPLLDEPAITYAYAGGPQDLRELAADELEATTSAGGSFEQLLDGIDPADPGAERVLEAQREAELALAILRDTDYDVDPGALDNFLESAIGELLAALDDPGEVDPEGIRSLIDELLDIGRMVARFHLDRAEDTCGSCVSGQPGEVCQSGQALADGDALRRSGAPDLEQAVKLYGEAAGKALDAIADCG